MSKKGLRTDEEHWKKVLQANEKSGFYNNTRKCRKNGGFGSFRRRICKQSPEMDVSRDVAPSFARRVYCWLNNKFESNNNQLPSNETSQQIENQNDGLDPSPTGHTSQTKSVCIADEDENYVYIKHTSRVQEENRNTGNTICLPTKTPTFTLTECCSQELLKSPGETSDRRLPLTSTKSCPSQRQSTCKQDVVHFNWTWPMSRKRRSIDKYEGDDSNDSVFSETPAFQGYSEKRISQYEFENPETLGEFSISDCDLEFGECITRGRNIQIFRGKFHGEVDIHYFGELDENESQEFWENVTKLRRIRHENTALFMGACADPKRLSIVQSVEGGCSLYQQIHIKKSKFQLRSKVQCLSQIANGMGYLHAKGVVLKHLSTRNVFLCPKTRISVMDYEIPAKHHEREGYATLPRGKICYMAPEILSVLKVVPPNIVIDSNYGRESDVYAFGTIIFELLSYRYPYEEFNPEVCIYQVCKGYRQDVDRYSGSKSLKVLAERCWSHNKYSRPAFTYISGELSNSGYIRKQHSSSEPENVHRIGSGQGLL